LLFVIRYLLEQHHKTQAPVVLTANGKAVAVLIGVKKYEK
jgi:prevent-host-death family protein